MKDDILDLHKDFWRNKASIVNTECTLAARVKALELGRRGLSDLPLADGSRLRDNIFLEPAMLSPEMLHALPKPQSREKPTVCDKVFEVIFPYHKIMWLPGMVGCKLQVSLKAETLWPRPCLGKGWHRSSDPEIPFNQEWFEMLLEFTHYLIDNFHPGYLVVQDMIARGPGDLLANMLGVENMVISMYRHPKETKRLLDKLADLFIKVATAQFKAIPSSQNGYCNQYGIWAPGTSIRIQEDLSINLSSDLIREFLVPPFEKIVSNFGYSTVHTHSGHMNLPLMLSEIPALKAVEVAADPMGPKVEELVPMMSKIQKNKPILFMGDFSPKELSFIAGELSEKGLLLEASVPKPIPTQ